MYLTYPSVASDATVKINGLSANEREQKFIDFLIHDFMRINVWMKMKLKYQQQQQLSPSVWFSNYKILRF